MGKKLDLKDQKILYLLKEDARISLKNIAKSINASPETTHHRIKKLEEKYITNYTLITNHIHLGFESYDLYISLRNVSEELLEEFHNYLKNNKHTKYAESCVGEYDLIITLIAKSRRELSNFSDNLLKKFNKIIGKIDFIMKFDVLKSDHLSFLFKENMPFLSMSTIHESEIKVDEKDKEVLKALSEQPKNSFIKLSKNTSLSHDSCVQRYNKLKKQNTIVKIEAVIDYARLGVTTYVLLLRVENLTSQEILKHKEWLSKQKNILLTARLLGTYDIKIHLVAKDQQEFNQILNNIRKHFKIKKHIILVKTEQIKYQGTPEVLTK